MAEIITTTASSESVVPVQTAQPMLTVEGLLPYDIHNPAHNQLPLTLLPEAEQPVTIVRAPESGQGNHPTPEPVIAEAAFLLQVEAEVSRRLRQLNWWQKPFAEQIKPFLRAKAKEQLRAEATGILATSSLAAETARMVGDDSRKEEVAAVYQRTDGSRQKDIPALREASGTRAVVKAVAHEYVKKGTAVTSLAAAGLMFVPGGQLIGGAAIAVHGAAKLKTTVHDAGVRAREHVAHAQIRLQATGTAGEDMSALARIRQNMVRAHQLPASTVKEIGVKALAYAGALLSPLGEEHQIARAGAKGFSRMLSADELLASREDVLANADVTMLVSTSERIQQSLARGYVRNVQRVQELEVYKDALDAQVVHRASHASEILAARKEQGQIVAAELEARARADAKWVARHELSHKLAYGALSSVAAARMVLETTVAAEGLASMAGINMPGVPVAHAVATHVTEVHMVHSNLHQQLVDQHAAIPVPTKEAPLIDEGVLRGHSQDFAIDTTPDGNSIRFYSLDGAGNAVMLQSDGHTYVIPFEHGQLVLGHNGTVNAVTEDGTIVQLNQDDVLKYLGIDQHVQDGLQHHGGVLELSGYQIRHITEVQYDAHTGVYHKLASTSGEHGGTFEPHSDTLPVQHIDQGGTNHGGGGSGTTGQPTPSPTPGQNPTPTPGTTTTPTHTPTPSPSPTTISPSPTATPDVHQTANPTYEGSADWGVVLGIAGTSLGLAALGAIVGMRAYRNYRGSRIGAPTHRPVAPTGVGVNKGPVFNKMPPPSPIPMPVPDTSLPNTKSGVATVIPAQQPAVWETTPAVILPAVAPQSPNTAPAQPTGSLINRSPEDVPVSKIDLPRRFKMRYARVHGKPVIVESESYTPDSEYGQMETPQYVVGWASDRGDERRHKDDEDTVKVIEVRGITLAVLADGMGGQANGAAASELVVAKLEERFRQLALDEFDEDDLTKDWAKDALTKAVQYANKELWTKNEKEKEEKRKEAEEQKKRFQYSETDASGSTVTVAAVLPDGSYTIANVGDSRAYRVTSTVAERLTVDHSLVESLVEAGVIKQRTEVYTHPKNNRLYRSMGEGPDVEVGIFVSDDGNKLQPSDELLLCCDGMWEMVREGDGSVTNAQKLRTIARSSSIPQEAARRLVLAALYGDGKTYGGADNISGVIVRRKPVTVAA